MQLWELPKPPAEHAELQPYVVSEGCLKSAGKRKKETLASVNVPFFHPEQKGLGN